MGFNNHGYLDAGLHKLTLQQIEEEFVIPFPHSSTRPIIIEGYKRHLAEMSALLTEFQQFIDGSFVTIKNDPGDIDMVCFVDGDIIDAMSPEDFAKFEALVGGKATQGTHHCDAYFCLTYPSNHKYYDKIRLQRKYWMGEFGFDRSDVAKGIVVVEPVPTPQIAAGAPVAEHGAVLTIAVLSAEDVS